MSDIYTDDTLSLHEKNIDKASDYIREIEYIPLLNSDQHILKEISKLSINNGKVFVSSMVQGKLCVYSIKGEFLYEIDARGHAEGEYYELRSFCVSDKYVYILDNAKHAVLCYDQENGKYVDSKRIRFTAWDLECFDDNNFIFAFHHSSGNGKVDTKQPDCGIWMTNADMKITKQYTEFTNNHDLIGKQCYFRKCKGKIVYHDFKTPGYFVFGGIDSTYHYTHVELGKNIPTQHLTNYKEVKANKYKYLSETPFLTDDFIALAVCSGDEEESMLCAKKDGGICGFAEETSYNYMPFPNAVYNDIFVCYMCDYDIYTELAEDGFQRIDKKSEMLLQSGGAVLFLYHCK